MTQQKLGFRLKAGMTDCYPASPKSFQLRLRPCWEQHRKTQQGFLLLPHSSCLLCFLVFGCKTSAYRQTGVKHVKHVLHVLQTIFIVKIEKSGFLGFFGSFLKSLDFMHVLHVLQKLACKTCETLKIFVFEKCSNDAAFLIY